MDRSHQFQPLFPPGLCLCPLRALGVPVPNSSSGLPWRGSHIPCPGTGVWLFPGATNARACERDGLSFLKPAWAWTHPLSSPQALPDALQPGPQACPPNPCLVPPSYPPPDTGTCHGLYPGSWASWSERAESLVTLARHCLESPSLLLSSPASPPQGSWSPHPNLCHPTYQLPLLQTHIKAPGSVWHQLPQGHPQLPQGRRPPPSPQPWVLTHTQPSGRPCQMWPGKPTPTPHLGLAALWPRPVLTAGSFAQHPGG